MLVLHSPPSLFGPGRDERVGSKDLGNKLISLYEGGEDLDEEDNNGPGDIDEIYQLLTFLWATSKQCWNSVTLGEIPEEGVVVMSLCQRKALTPLVEISGTIERPQFQQGAPQGAAAAESRRFTAAMALNLTKWLEAYV